MQESDMADPKDLQEAADAIHEVRGLALFSDTKS
jgi:hypothetical protein